jgi:hypothetical protein
MGYELHIKINKIKNNKKKSNIKSLISELELKAIEKLISFSIENSMHVDWKWLKDSIKIKIY